MRLHKRQRQTTQAAELTAQISERELAAILAGLRLLQETIAAGQLLNPDIQAIFDDNDLLVPLQIKPPFTQPDEIDLLCERLNAAGERHASAQRG